MAETKIFLNTWGAYNNGEIGYGWMTPQEALDFIDENQEKDGGEFLLQISTITLALILVQLNMQA